MFDYKVTIYEEDDLISPKGLRKIKIKDSVADVDHERIRVYLVTTEKLEDIIISSNGKYYSPTTVNTRDYVKDWVEVN